MLKKKGPMPQTMRPRRPQGEFGKGSGTPGQIKKKPYEDKIMKIAKDKKKADMQKRLKDMFEKIKEKKGSGRVSVDDIKRSSKMNKGGYAKGKK